MAFDVQRMREDFPILSEQVHGKPLCYLDNAATAQLPLQVLETVEHHYRHDNGNVHRGIHTLSNRSTAKLENARSAVADHIGAPTRECVVFTSGTTAAINMVATSLERSNFLKDRAIAVSLMEHHSNFVTWQQTSVRQGSSFHTLALTADADIDLDGLERSLSENDVALVALTHVSNVTGAINDVARITRMAHDHGAAVLIDAAQSAPHMHIDVSDIGCDFLAFSGHKMYALTGIGALYVAPQWHQEMAPFMYGGEMVDKVGLDSTTFEEMPLRLEAGTPSYVGSLSLGSAIDYLNSLDREGARRHEEHLTRHALNGLAEMREITVLGNPSSRGPVISFVAEGAHPYDIASLMDLQGVAVRSGTSCAQPLLNEFFHIKNMTRMSFAPYNTIEEVDCALEALQRALFVLKRS